MSECSLTVHNFAAHGPGHKLQRGMLLKMSGKVYTSQTHKLLHERDHTHTPKGQPKPHAQRQTHRGKNCQPQSRRNLRVPTKPWSPLDTTLYKSLGLKPRLATCLAQRSIRYIGTWILKRWLKKGVPLDDKGPPEAYTTCELYRNKEVVVYIVSYISYHIAHNKTKTTTATDLRLQSSDKKANTKR